ncbi:MAG: hypothetical protein AB8B97_28660 [Granulosicoccus sp.]
MNADIFLGFPAESPGPNSCRCHFDKAMGISFSDVSDVEYGSLFGSIHYTKSDTGKFQRLTLDTRELHKPDFLTSS